MPRDHAAGGAAELVAVVPEEAGMGGPWIAAHPSGSHLYASIRDGGAAPAHAGSRRARSRSPPRPDAAE